MAGRDAPGKASVSGKAPARVGDQRIVRIPGLEASAAHLRKRIEGIAQRTQIAGRTVVGRIALARIRLEISHESEGRSRSPRALAIAFRQMCDRRPDATRSQRRSRSG